MSVMRGKQSDRFLKLSYDRKVAPTGWWQQSRRRWVPTLPNSFGLPAGVSCPGKTEFCTSCYAQNSERGSGVEELVTHNLQLLLEAETVEGMTGLIAEMVGRFYDEFSRRLVPEDDYLFRVHWDGDFFSTDYAQAWANVIRMYPQVKFWAYTRSFTVEVNVVPILAGIENLALYLSTDKHNVDAAHAALVGHDDVLLALCDVDYQRARNLAPERPSMVCPENSGRMTLMSSEGRGACVDCRLCVDGKRDVIFSTTHQEDVSSPQLQLWAVSDVPVVVLRRGVTQCASPSCERAIEQGGGRGRPKKYCNEQCRWDAHHLRNKIRESASA